MSKGRFVSDVTKGIIIGAAVVGITKSIENGSAARLWNAAKKKVVKLKPLMKKGLKVG